MKFKLFPLFILLALSAPMSAESMTVEKFDDIETCTDVRLDLPGGPFASIPVYNQALGTVEDPNICYAITASELIDANRIRHRNFDGKLTSPISLAVLARIGDTSKQMSPSRFGMDDTDPLTFLVGGGSVDAALDSASGHFVCDQRFVESTAKLINPGSSGLPLDQFLSTVAGKNTRLNMELLDAVSSQLSAMCEHNGFVIKTLAPKSLAAPGGDYLTAYSKLVEKLKDSNLTPAKRKQLGTEFNSVFDPERKIILFDRQVNELLGALEPRPVGIGYLYGAIQPVSNSDSIAAHASVIIGRRLNSITNKCEFLVRNSYGQNCSDHDGGPLYNLPCENGSVWVEVRALMGKTINLYWLP